MDNKLVVFFGEKRRVCANSSDNILGGNTLHRRRLLKQRGGGWRRAQGRHMEQMVTTTCRTDRLYSSRPCHPCSQLSFEGQRHHFASRLAYALLPLLIRKRRRRRHHHHHHHHHPQNLMRGNKQFTTSCQNVSNPPSCSYKTFLVRHPATRILVVYSLFIIIIGGCGTFFAITIASKKFRGIPVVKQHRLVNTTLKKEIEGIHGLQVPRPLPLLSPLPY
jgi:stress-induced morphogen